MFQVSSLAKARGNRQFRVEHAPKSMYFELNTLARTLSIGPLEPKLRLLHIAHFVTIEAESLIRKSFASSFLVTKNKFKSGSVCRAHRLVGQRVDDDPVARLAHAQVGVHVRAVTPAAEKVVDPLVVHLDVGDLHDELRARERALSCRGDGDDGGEGA
eukprot:6174376-Pleurochrysis_carterae.AAC.3